MFNLFFVLVLYGILTAFLSSNNVDGLQCVMLYAIQLLKPIVKAYKLTLQYSTVHTNVIQYSMKEVTGGFALIPSDVLGIN